MGVEGELMTRLLSDSDSSSSKQQQPTMQSSEVGVALARSVVVHPLVLLSVQDHAARVAKGTRKRVVGVLLGQDNGPAGINVSNSFAGAHLSSQLIHSSLYRSRKRLPQCRSRRMSATLAPGSWTTTTSSR